ncbi:MAG: tRNA-uridine aminocarboxypropyltransferase [Myxococcota bacterium]
MGKRRNHRERNRCEACQLHPTLCLCAEIRVLPVRTRVVVLMHQREIFKSSGTGRLAARALQDGAVLVRGERDSRLDGSDVLHPQRQALVLYPDENAAVLTPEYVARDGRPVTLVVPDGTWRQARKVMWREPWLLDVPRVCLPAGAPSSYGLRHTPYPERTCTLEAIARALEILEGPSVRVELERLLGILVERTRFARGVLEPDAAQAVMRSLAE